MTADDAGLTREEEIQEVPPDELRRLHPLTPLLRSWRLVGAACAIGLGVFRDQLQQLQWFWEAAHGDVAASVLLRGLGILVAVTVVVVFASWLSWRVTGFAIVTDPTGVRTLLYQRGLLVRQRRQVRLNRVQSVDVNQPFYARVWGLASVRLDMAAGEDASVDLAFMRVGEAWKLRAEILQGTSATSASLGQTAAEVSSDTLVAQVSTRHVVYASLLDGIFLWGFGLLWLIGIVVVVVIWGTAAIIPALSGIVVITLGILAQTRRQILAMFRDANFRLHRTPTGIRVSSGLTSTVNRTIDYDRIQGVRVEEPWLWRRFGWARVLVDIAGAKGDGEEAASLMPVSDRAAAFALVADVTGAALDAQAYDAAGHRAKVLDPWGWSYLGVALLEHGAARREGRWRRKTSYVPYARVQSVSARQGAAQRKLDLATIHLDVPKGAARWTARHRGAADAAQLAQSLGALARQHRMSESASS